MRDKPMVIVGSGAIADIIGAYFERVADVVAYTVDADHITSKTFRDRPLVPFDNIQEQYPPEQFDMFVAIGYIKLNHIRARFYREAKAKGYTLVSYVHDKALVDDTVKLGDNVFIFEFNNIQFKANIGNNVILWSSNHIGHETIIKDHAYVASHVVVSGNCVVDSYSFLGVNAAVGDGVHVGKDCLIGMGANIIKDTGERKVFVASRGSKLEFKQLSDSARDMYEPLNEE